MIQILAHALMILMFSTPSTVVINDDGECAFWYYDHDPKKHNPCGNDGDFVPDNAKPIGIDEYENTNACT